MSQVKVVHEEAELTRKQRREQARGQRRALEAAEAAGAIRRKRLRLLGIVSTLVVVGIVVVLIATAGAGSVKKIAPEGGEARRVSGEVTSLLSGIPQTGDVLGRSTAPVTLQYYGDLQCPVCRSFTTQALSSIIGRWVRPGELRIEYRSLQTATREPEVFLAQQSAALAAGRQNRMWNFLETFYREQQEEGSGYVTGAFIQGIARQVPGLSLARWTSERGDPAFSNQLAGDAQAASGQGLNGTPAFLIGRSGGSASRLEPSSYSDPGSFDQAIAKLAKS
jgi:protein-disulfide isomerase